MNRSEETRRYKWSSSATNLLVSIWCHDLVQNQLKISSRNQPIWESIARYMSRKGFSVTGVQCRTRIKNMLFSYHEAVKKKDTSCIEPYYEIFRKVLGNERTKKKDSKLIKFKPAFEEQSGNEDNVTLDSDSLDLEQSVENNPTDSEYQMQFKFNSSDSQSSTLLNSVLIQRLEKVIVKSIKSQTKSIIKAINMQSQMIEKLLVAEGERLEAIVASERESRRQMETSIDNLLSRLEDNCVTKVETNEYPC